MVWRFTKPSLSPTFSATPSGWNSIWSITLVWASSSRWKVTTPACRASPETVVQATRSSGICSVISASNSRCTPLTLVTQCVSVSVRCSTRCTPPMNSGKLSNCVHWL